MKSSIAIQRKQFFDQLEQHLQETEKPEERLFYYHRDEDRIVLSHALFWVMSNPYVKKFPHLQVFLLLRKYEELMLEAYLTESDEFPELLRYCSLTYEMLPYELGAAIKAPGNRSAARQLRSVAVVACGYGGDMPEVLVDELLDDMDFEYNKVRCRKIDQLLPRLRRMVEEELGML